MKKNWIKFVLFILITMTVVIGIDAFVFVEMNNTAPYAQFFKEEKNSIDIVFIGNSTVKHGISPMTAWENYEITTYNVSDTPIHPEVITLAIEDVAKTQNPKLVYIDLTGLTYQTVKGQQYFVKRYYASLNDEKRKKELLEKYDYLSEKEEENEIFKYHNNFRNTEYYKQNDENIYLKGYGPKYDVPHLKESKLTLDDTILELSEDGKYYITRILETCKKYPHIQFAFGRMPRVLDKVDIEQTYMLRSSIPEINSYGYEYFELENYYDKIGLKADTDFYDTIHMNHFGAEKFTKYFVGFLKDHYNVEVRQHSAQVKKNFDDGYKKYEKKVKNKADRKMKKSMKNKNRS